MKLTKDTLIEGHVYKEGVEVEVESLQEAKVSKQRFIDVFLPRKLHRVSCGIDTSDFYIGKIDNPKVFIEQDRVSFDKTRGNGLVLGFKEISSINSSNNGDDIKVITKNNIEYNLYFG